MKLVEDNKNEQKMVEEKPEEIIEEEVEGFPKWIKLRSDGLYNVYDRNKKCYTFKDVPNKKINRIQKRVLKLNNGKFDEVMFQTILVSESLVEPKLGELAIDDLPGSIVTRLKIAVVKIFDLDCFL